MIRRLRWKIVAINMAMVTAVLLAVFAGVLLSSRAAVERTVNQRLMQVVQTGRYDASLPGEGSAPCFVADIYPSGTVRLSGSSYYQLDDQDAMAEIVTACLSRGIPPASCGAIICGISGPTGRCIPASPLPTPPRRTPPSGRW